MKKRADGNYFHWSVGLLICAVFAAYFFLLGYLAAA